MIDKIYFENMAMAEKFINASYFIQSNSEDMIKLYFDIETALSCDTGYLTAFDKAGNIIDKIANLDSCEYLDEELIEELESQGFSWTGI